MSATGIGAPVRRKEDHRFITGKGQYTDDINRPGQTYAYFVRSPHAHASIKKVDISAALKKPGCLAVFTGDDIAADKVGGLFCGWMITSKDGSPMKPGSHPVLVEVNGRPAVLTVRDSEPDTLLSFEVGPDGIKRLLFVRNPHKLERLRPLIRPEGGSE